MTKPVTKISFILCCTIFLFSISAIAGPVPDTGQTKCYDGTHEIPCPQPGQPFYGQDAEYTINHHSYTAQKQRMEITLRLTAQ